MLKVKISVFRTIAIILCIGLFIELFPTAAFAETSENSPKVVRVGWFDSSYNTMDSFGRRTGYCYEYERKIAAYTGWKYEYVEGSWVELLEMLEKGEIDILGGVSYTKERAEKILYPSYPMGTEEYHLYISGDNIDRYNEDLSFFNKKKICVNKNSIQEDLLKEWAKANNLTPNIIEVTSSENEAVQMLVNGEIDGYVTLDNYLNVDVLVPVAKIGYSDFFFAVTSSRTDLLQELNIVMSKIQDENRFYAEELFVKYNKKSGANLFLTHDEKGWLAEYKTINVGYIDDYLIYCDKDDFTGELNGVLKDYLDKASNCFANAHIDFKTTAYKSSADSLTALYNGEIDCVFPANFSDYEGEMTGLVLTPTLARATLYTIVKSSEHQNFGEKKNTTVAVVANDSNYESFIKDNYPMWKTVEYDNVKDCLAAVSKGSADCFLISSYRYNSIHRLCEKYRLVSLDTGRDVPFCFAVKEGNTHLYSILAKATNIIPDSYINNMITQYFSEERKDTLLDFVKDNIVVVISILTVMIAMLMLIIVQRRLIIVEKKANEHRRVADDLSRRVYVDALTSVRNKGGYTEYLEELKVLLDKGELEEFSICMFDCDDLKYINDKFGHEKGDEYLKAASQLICQTFCHSPIFRIGGDEFTAVLTGEDYKYRHALIKEFEAESRYINSSSENEWDHVNVSLGMADYDLSIGETIEDIAKRADERMYENKRKRKSGRTVR